MSKPRSKKSRGMSRGRYNLRGKKSRLLGCGCCIAENRIEKIEAGRVQSEEIRTAVIDENITILDYEVYMETCVSRD